MERLSNLNLIHLLDFYLAAAFLVSIFLRVRQYRAILGLVRAVPGRWPRLFKLVKEHRTIFLTWSTILPALLALVLSVSQIFLSRLVWPAVTDREANLTPAILLHQWPACLLVGLFGLAMLAVDVYMTFDVEDVDRNQLEKYFDQAEYWLRSWAAPVVRIFTLGFVNPRYTVAVEVRAALVDASRLLNSALWWVSAQVGMRVAYAIALWLTYVASHT